MANIKNTKQSYGVITIAIHWLFALTLFGLFGLGLYMVELSYYDSWYKGSLDLHKSIGVLLFLGLIARIVWRFVNVQPQSLSDKAWENKSAHWVHVLLYLVPLALMITGYLISTADGRGIEVFELFSIPAMAMTVAIDNQEDIAGLIHEILAWLVIGIAALHALAAFKHHIINKDQTLNRIIGR